MNFLKALMGLIIVLTTFLASGSGKTDSNEEVKEYSLKHSYSLQCSPAPQDSTDDDDDDGIIIPSPGHE